ncbi:MAG: ComEC/Rec2 family competence protein [Acidimicrobiales bacterium]
MSPTAERFLWTMVVAAWIGALSSVTVGVVGLLVAALVVGVARRWWGYAILALLVVGQLSSWSFAQLGSVGEQPLVGEVRLITDPEPIGRGLRADVATPLGRLQIRASGRAADDLIDFLAGDRVVVVAKVVPRPAGSQWLLNRRVLGLLEVDRIVAHRPASGVRSVANSLRGLLEDGALSLGPEGQSLFTGLVVGDDRWQSPQTADAFRGAGLGHLLAVSGQNVAFVLLLAGPFLRRAPLWLRLPATLGFLGFFALITRFEPSVLRASVMAALAATATVAGRPGTGRAVLALAALILLTWDPLLAFSVGFQLSVLASLGIMVIGPPLAKRLPGPSGIRHAIAATVGAQVAVAPLLLATFDEVPVAGLPANLVAAPAAGPVMIWGMSAGILAGWSGGGLAELIHLPTRLLIGWISGTAEWASTAGLGSYRWSHLVAGLLIGVALIVIGPDASAWLRVGAAAALFAVLVAPVLTPRVMTGASVSGSGVNLWRDRGAAVVELEPRSRPADALEFLRSEKVVRIDLLVVDGASRGTVDAVVGRYREAHVLDASSASRRGAYQVGGLLVRFASSSRGVQTIVDRRSSA